MNTEHPSQNQTPNDKAWERTLDLFKLEYEQVAQRYENIYKAIWQIFQYMAILSAGILTFASKGDVFPQEFIIFIALTPLVFWFLAIYIPMDKYGQDARNRLKNMERKINERFPSSWPLNHYLDFANMSDQKVNILSSPMKWWWRTRGVIIVFGIIVLLVWICYFFLIIPKFPFTSSNSKTEKLEVQLQPVEVNLQKTELEKINNTLTKLSQKLDSIELYIKQNHPNTTQTPSP